SPKRSVGPVRFEVCSSLIQRSGICGNRTNVELTTPGVKDTGLGLTGRISFTAAKFQSHDRASTPMPLVPLPDPELQLYGWATAKARASSGDWGRGSAYPPTEAVRCRLAAPVCLNSVVIELAEWFVPTVQLPATGVSKPPLARRFGSASATLPLQSHRSSM